MNFNNSLPRIRVISIRFEIFSKLCAISELGSCANSELADSFSELLKPKTVLTSAPGQDWGESEERGKSGALNQKWSPRIQACCSCCWDHVCRLGLKLVLRKTVLFQGEIAEIAVLSSLLTARSHQSEFPRLWYSQRRLWLHFTALAV